MILRSFRRHSCFKVNKTVKLIFAVFVTLAIGWSYLHLNTVSNLAYAQLILVNAKSQILRQSRSFFNLSGNQENYFFVSTNQPKKDTDNDGPDLPANMTARIASQHDQGIKDQGEPEKLRTSSSSRNGTDLPVCPDTPPGLVGFQAVNDTEVSIEYLERAFRFFRSGGHYSPPDCRPRQKTAIIIPYRDRWKHLLVLLNNLVPILVRQQAFFTIFVVEQESPGIYNKAVLLNTGITEALKSSNYTCIIFHDVDVVPLNDHTYYRCGSSPIHLSVALSRFNYTIRWPQAWGGVVAMTREQVEKVNGFSNIYFGWGREDDDLRQRIVAKGMRARQESVKIARFYVIEHARDAGNEVNPLRDKLMRLSWKRMDEDGLNTLKYKVKSIQFRPLFTWLKVNLNQTEILMNSPAYVRQQVFGKSMQSLAKQAPSERELQRNETAEAQKKDKKD